jgi:hypothetical protein
LHLLCRFFCFPRARPFNSSVQAKNAVLYLKRESARQM